MSEQPVPFSQTPAEPTEKERIQQRLQNFRVQLTPQTAQAVQALLVSYLKSDMVKIEDLEVMLSIRNEVNFGLEEYKKVVEVAQKQFSEISDKENQQKQIELAERIQREKEKLNNERVMRKNLEDRARKLEEEKRFLEKRVVQAQTTQASQPLTREDVVPKKPTKAFEEAKAKRQERKGGSKTPEITKSKLPEKPVQVSEPPPTLEVKSEPEYEEITIPSRNDLERMTKTAIKKEADKLKFKVSTDDTKKEMIVSFEKQTEQLIEKLQSSGEFVSATTDGDDETNVRDGGTF